MQSFCGEVVLVSPAKEHEQQYYAMLSEWKEADENFIPGTTIKPSEEDYDSLLKILESYKNRETCPPHYVTSDMYFLIDNFKKIVGIASLRHYLNETLSIRGGHIGYWIHPSERRKGYAKIILRLTLEKCRGYAIERVLITCSKSNIASVKTIIANGGVLESEAVDEKCDVFQRYWIEIE
ncbi:MAG: GNAT family N-acetyltransferase [Negativicutes bacterium]|jgi:predicted acetyltransferase